MKYSIEPWRYLAKANASFFLERGRVRKMLIYNVKNMQDIIQQHPWRSQPLKSFKPLLELAFYEHA